MTNTLVSNNLPKFPQELFELFVDAVANLPISDPLRRPTLLSCNLVSRSFCHISRRHLFKKIELDDQHQEDLSPSLSSLHELMTWTQPKYRLQGIARYIKEFSFHISLTDADETMELLDNNSTLAAVLESLHCPDYGIHTLVMFFHWESVEWNYFSIGLQKAFYDLFRSPRLRYLRICNMNRLPKTFLRGTHIKHLHLYECLADDAMLPQPLRYSCDDDTLPYPQLEVLDTDHELPLSYFEKTPRSTSESSITNLRVLSSAVLVSHDFEEALEVIDRSRESLERLDLRYYVLETPLAPRLGCFDLSNVLNLHHLCLYHSGGLTASQGPGLALDDFICFLETVKFPSSGSMHTIEFVILMDGGKETAQLFLDSFLPEHHESYKWQMLDTMLTRVCLEGQHSVRNVIMSFHFDRPIASEVPHGRSVFREKAGMLVQKSLGSVVGGEGKEGAKAELRIDIVFSSQIESWTPRTLEDSEI